MKISISIVLLILLASSCRKKDIDVPFKDIKGDYEWYYSNNGAGDSYAFDTSEDKFGIRITGNGRLKFFKNGILEEDYRIMTTSSWSDGSTSFTVKELGESNFFGINGETLNTSFYPYNDHSNNFSKSK